MRRRSRISIRPRPCRIRPPSLSSPKASVTVVRCTPSMVARYCWVRRTASSAVRSCDIRSQRQSRWFSPVQGVAGDRLVRLGEVGLSVPHQKPAQARASIGLMAQARGRYADDRARNLGEGPVHRDAAAQGVEHADHALVAHGVAFDGASVSHDRDHRKDRGVGEIDPIDRIVRLVQSLARHERDCLSERLKRLSVAVGQGRAGRNCESAPVLLIRRSTSDR